MLLLLSSALAIMLASLTGVVTIVSALRPVVERHTSVLVSFAAGVFSLVGYTLLVEVFEEAATPVGALSWVTLGALGILFLFWLLPAFHHHHDEEAEHHPHSRLDARRILVGDGVHNIGDGVLLAAAFAVSNPFGLITMASILLHEDLQKFTK